MKKLYRIKSFAIAMTVAVVSGNVPIVTAADATKRASAVLMEEVLVTGRKKSDAELLQDVPVAITAVSGEQIEAMFATDLTDIGYQAPNVSLNPVATIPNYANFVIRGFGLNGSVLSDDPSVGVIIDGMYLGVPAGVVTNTFDLEGIEILRGPQGTLFGRNVTGGAALLTTRQPAEEFSFRARTIYGNDSNKQIMVSVDAPMADDKAYSRMTILYSEHGDSYDNVVEGPGDLGEKDLLVIRPKLRLTPTEHLTINLSAEYGDGDAEPGARRFLFNAFKGTIGGVAVNSGIPSVVSNNSNKVSVDFIPEVTTTWKHAIAEVIWHFTDRSTLKSITSWRDLKQSNIAQDIDGTGIDFFNFRDGFINQEQYSQEFILTTEVRDNIELTTGVYYFEQEYDYGEQREIGKDFGLGGGPGIALDQAGVGTIEHDTSAVFAQADFLLNDNWIMNIGARMTWESKDAALARRLTGECRAGTSNGTLPNCVNAFFDDESWSNFTPKIGVQYTLNDDTQTYASFTKGFRSGGFNIRATSESSTGPYEEEKIDAWEIGLKTDFLGNRGRLNLAVFLNQFEDLQRTLLNADANQEIINVGEGDIWGAEMELSYLVGDNLLLQATFGYVESEFDEFTDLDVDGIPGADPELAKNLEIAHVPHFTSNLTATYDLSVPIGWISLRGNYSFTGDSFADDANRYEISGYEMWNASATLVTDDSNWSFSLFGKNLTDEVYYQSVFLFGVLDVADLGARRSFGISATYEY